MKKIVLYLCCAALVVPQVYSSVNIGDAAPEIQIGKWLKKPAQDWEDTWKKQIMVLFFWQCETPSILAFQTMGAVAKQFQKNGIEFFGIACDDEKKVAELSWVSSMPFAMGVDKKGKSRNLYVGDDPLPLCVIVDKSGSVLWKCPPDQLSGLLSAVLAGKMDMAESRHIHEFTPILQKAIADGNNEKALELISAEQKRKFNPELTRLQAGLLVKTGRPEAAVNAISNAIEQQPDNAKLHIFRLTVVRQYLPDKQEQIRVLQQDTINKLKINPLSLLELLQYELGLPADSVDPDILVQIAAEAKNSKLLKTDLEKAQTQLAYARIMHFLGFNRKAAEAAESAHLGFTNKADQMDALDFAKLCRKLAAYQEKRQP